MIAYNSGDIAWRDMAFAEHYILFNSVLLGCLQWSCVEDELFDDDIL